MIAIIATAWLFAATSVSDGATLSPGDIVVSQIVPLDSTPGNDELAILDVDPLTGDRTVISDNFVGSGPSFLPTGVLEPQINSLSWQSDGSILAAERGDLSDVTPDRTQFGQILRIDPATGNRTLIVDSTTTQYFTARQYSNNIMTIGSTPAGVELQIINPATGTPTIVSGGGIGSGPDLKNPVGFAIAGTNVFVADETQGLMSINILTGNRVILSGSGVGTGPTIVKPSDVAVSPGGNLFVSTEGSGTGGALMSVDPTTGNRTIISSDSVGTGPVFLFNSTILALDQAGSIFTTTFPDSLLQIDPVTGDRTVIASTTQGTGPWGIGPSAFDGILVVPSVPEPSTVLLAAMGAFALLVWRQRLR